ncbi:SH3 domain-containing protein [Chryseomicrobium sp. FSL W7-1435]|uniref:SH3 domain-containing protein n=1 Tax=Chryseomicrobium sp. FSL W7-1435 TaxID=2921704 RepID=UPI00315A6EC4
MQNFRTYGFIILIFFLLIAPLSTIAQSVIVNTDSLKVRSGPGLTYEVIGSVKSGDSLEVLATENDWYQIAFNGQNGWVASWLTTGSTEAVANQSAVVQVKTLNVRADASTSSSKLGQLAEGTSIQVNSIKGDWLEITFNGSTGWIHKEYVQLIEGGSAAPEQIEQNAFSVQVDALNVRDKPSLDSKRTATVYRNEVFSVLSTESTWVEIELNDGSSGWVYSFYGTFQAQQTQASQAANASSDTTLTILYNGTNLRSQPSTSGEVRARLDAGQQLTVLQAVDDWYEVSHQGESLFVANWVVTTGELEEEQPEAEQQEVVSRKAGTLAGLTIVLDPGHGGNDSGTSGYYGTNEKDLTLPTAELLAAKLEAAGAEVAFTRESDVYVGLRKRVSISHQNSADAFVSIHYDSVSDSSVHGFTTYYQHGFQKPLADHLHSALQKRLSLRDRGVREGNYLVLRENQQYAVLLELGYLSNASEERTVANAQFRETAAHAIYEGLISFFDSQLDE